MALAGAALAKGPPVIGLPNRKFDHDRHVAAAGAKPADCAACHDEKKKFDHDRCVGCHTFPSSCSVMQTPGPKAPARVCQVCHIPTHPECLPKDLPPLPKTSSFEAKFTHGKHQPLGASIEKDCGVCHPQQAEAPKQSAHTMCSGCHNANGVKPAINECAGCHVAPTPHAAAGSDPFRLAGFDHKLHTQASKLVGACLSCHDKAVGDTPKPTMLGCLQRCHDGKKSFAATGTNCTTCHKGTTPATPARNDVGFSHAEHAKRGTRIDDCSFCHGIEPDGTLDPPLARKEHMPCANGACHQSEFMDKTPKICGVCHDSAVPWQKAVSRAGKPLHMEWSEQMSHASHLAKGIACEACHGDKRTNQPPPRQHAECAPCHGKGQPPAMTDCAGCHTTKVSPRMQASEWNVAATFEHTKHANDPRSHRATACTECHTTIKAATNLAGIAPPRMADCEGCHDGKTSFKTTGFDCAKCHGAKK